MPAGNPDSGMEPAAQRFPPDADRQADADYVPFERSVSA